MLRYSKDSVRSTVIVSLAEIEIFALVECKVYFTHEAVSVDNEITLQIALKYDVTSKIMIAEKSMLFSGYLEMVFHRRLHSVNSTFISISKNTMI